MIMEKKMETTGLGLRVWGVGLSNSSSNVLPTFTGSLRHHHIQ